MQSALVKVVVVKVWRLFGAGPPVIAVPPHPVTIALTPPPVAAEAIAIARTFVLKVIVVSVCTTPTLKFKTVKLLKFLKNSNNSLERNQS